MAPVIVTSTPSPPPGLRTPPTPKHGPSDWEPYSPRKSTRISGQRGAHRTPPPRNSASQNHVAPSQSARKAHNKSQNHSGMVSPFATPIKKPQPSTADGANQSTSRRLTSESTAMAAASLGIDDKRSSRQTNISHATGMLPTPAKTPQKPPKENKASIEAFARNLFASEEMAGDKKKRAPKKYSGISMDSFVAEEVDEPIEIYTDSHERIPQKDDSTDNPFYGDIAVPATEGPAPRRSKRRLVHVPGEGRQTVDEAMKRQDGMVYVFRGKKIFRKFGEPEVANAEAADRDGSPVRNLPTRSSIQPRLLFPRGNQAKQAETTVDDEEADTDVEDHSMSMGPDTTEVMETEATEAPTTPRKYGDKSMPDTPQTPRFGPGSPPDSRRVTRAGIKKADTKSPVKRRNSTSPFDSWPRLKSRSDSNLHAKRAGSDLASSTTKKARA